jgi:hypothetical protein
MITQRNIRSREWVLRRQEQRSSRGRRGIITPAPISHAAPGLDGSRITCITPTGDRPLAFALCRQWMLHQTVKPTQWIVVDDGKVPMVQAAGFQYVRREPQPDDPQHTLNRNLATALPLITGDKILIIEDDEYYAPEYIEEMSRRLDQHEVVGLRDYKYYHLPTGGYIVNANRTHANLAETAFRNSFLYEMRETLNAADTFIDLRIWQRAGNRGYRFNDSGKSLFLGIKGLPGRAGIGIGHNPDIYRNQSDSSDRATLKRLAPGGYQVYMDILSGKLTSENHQSYFPADLPITGITVCWNTKDLIERAYNSIRKFYPEMPIIIIDGSDAGDPCATYVRGLASDKTTVISLGYNIGHGRGMCMGINHAETPYALMFDSDIELLKPCVSDMLAMMEEDTFGVGDVDETANKSRHINWTRNPIEGSIRYLQPAFQLIDIRNYKKFYPYVHHGAPCYLTMLDIHQKGLSGKIIKAFPGLGHFTEGGDVLDGAPGANVHHYKAATRQFRAKKNIPQIEQGWVVNNGKV